MLFSARLLVIVINYLLYCCCVVRNVLCFVLFIVRTIIELYCLLNCMNACIVLYYILRCVDPKYFTKNSSQELLLSS
jgi:hypothetical protein